MRGRWAILLLCLLIISTRIAYIIKDKAYIPSPKGELERTAACLVKNGYMGDPFGDSMGKSAHVAPLYTLLLAGMYWAFGCDTIAGRIAQEFLAVAATTVGICLLPWLARKTGLSSAAGWAAALCMALLPINLWIETDGSWESPYSALAVIGLLGSFCTLHEEQWRRRNTIVLTGLLMGLTTLLSPSVALAAGLLYIVEFINQRGRRKQVFQAGFVLAAACLLVLAPWTVRNYYALGDSSRYAVISAWSWLSATIRMPTAKALPITGAIPATPSNICFLTTA